MASYFCVFLLCNNTYAQECSPDTEVAAATISTPDPTVFCSDMNTAPNTSLIINDPGQGTISFYVITDINGIVLFAFPTTITGVAFVGLQYFIYLVTTNEPITFANSTIGADINSLVSSSDCTVLSNSIFIDGLACPCDPVIPEFIQNGPNIHN